MLMGIVSMESFFAWDLWAICCRMMSWSSRSCDPLWPLCLPQVGRSGLYAVGCCLLLGVMCGLLPGTSHTGNIGLYAVGFCLNLSVLAVSFFVCFALGYVTYVLPRSASEVF